MRASPCFATSQVFADDFFLFTLRLGERDWLPSHFAASSYSSSAYLARGPKTLPGATRAESGRQPFVTALSLSLSMDGAISLFLVPRKGTKVKRRKKNTERKREKEGGGNALWFGRGRHIRRPSVRPARLCRLIALFAFEELSASTAAAPPLIPSARASFQRQIAECLCTAACRPPPRKPLRPHAT